MSDNVPVTTADESESARSISFSSGEIDRPRWKRAGATALGGALAIAGLRRRSLGGAAIALAGGWVSYRALRGRSTGADDAQTVERSVTIGKPSDEVSDLARDPEHLERIAGHFADVTAAGEDRYRWTVDGPAGRRLSWEMRIAEETPGERLRLEPADEEVIGGGALFDDWSMSFRPAPGDRGTIATLEVRFDPPGGALGETALERLEAVPESLIGTALDRFKALAETGEIATTAGNPSARGRGDLV